MRFILNKLDIFFRSVFSFWDGTWLWLFSFWVIYLLNTYIFSLGNYNNACGIHIINKSFFCFDFLTQNIFLFIPEFILFSILFLTYVDEHHKAEIKWITKYHTRIRYFLFFYILGRFFTLYPINNPLNFFHENFYLVGYYSFYVLIFIYFLCIVLRKWDFSFNTEGIFNVQSNLDQTAQSETTSDKKEANNNFIDDLKNNFPQILEKIIYSTFKNIATTKEWWNVKLYTVKWYTPLSAYEIFVELELSPELIVMISSLVKEDWTLKIEANWFINKFKSARWNSKEGKNGLIIRFHKNTIDFSETILFPFLFEVSGLLKRPLDFCIGKDEDGKDIIINLADLPHLLIAWATKWWKSVWLMNILISLMKNVLRWVKIEFFIFDPKRIDFTIFKKLPWFHVATEVWKWVNMLNWLVAEMERRYQILENCAEEVPVANLEEYHEKISTDLPYIVAIIDEFWDIMTSEYSKDAERAIIRLSQKARAVGIHIILATQNPIHTVVTSNIKANLPSVLWFKAIDDTKSRVIIDDWILSEIKSKWEWYIRADWQDILHLKSYFVSTADRVEFAEYYKKEVAKMTMVKQNKESFYNGNSDEGVSIHLKRIENFQEVIDENSIETSSLSYKVFNEIFSTNGFENRNSLLERLSKYWVTHAKTIKIISQLKDKEYVVYDEQKKLNYIFPDDDQEDFKNEFLLWMYNTIHLILSADKNE